MHPAERLSSPYAATGVHHGSSILFRPCSAGRIDDRRHLYKDFIEEASRLYTDGFEHDTADTSKRVNLYALVSRMRVWSSPRISVSTDRGSSVITGTYLTPNTTCRAPHA